MCQGKEIRNLFSLAWFYYSDWLHFVQLTSDDISACDLVAITDGTECADYLVTFNQNSLETFGVLTANAFTADYQLIAWSGSGAMLNVCNMECLPIACTGQGMRQVWLRWGSIYLVTLVLATPLGCWTVSNDQAARYHKVRGAWTN